MSAPAIAKAMPQAVRMPRFIRDSLRARILTGIGIMLLPLLGLAAGALLGINSVNARFKDVVDEVIDEVHPVMHLQVAIFRAAMPMHDYLVHGERSERDEFARLSGKVESAFGRLLNSGSFHLEEERTLLDSAHKEWRQAQSVSERLLTLPQPVGDAAAALEMKRVDVQFGRVVDLLAGIHELAEAEIDSELAKANATGRAVLWIVFGVFGLGFAVAAWAGAALAWSILARVKALSEGARAFSEGNFSHRVQLEGHDELGRLAGVFNSMAAELDKTHQALRETSIRDPLTGLYNRREFDRRLRHELERCHRYQQPLSLLMLDLDHFKAVNDGHGHPAGDKVLREIAGQVKQALRGSDEVVRYGGEEFAVILPDADKPGARVLAQRIRAAIAACAVAVDENRTVNVTVSIGLAGFPDDANCGEMLIAAADRALYDAKRAGRNCVCSFDPEQRMENPR